MSVNTLFVSTLPQDDKKVAKMERRAKALAAKGEATAGGGAPRSKKDTPVSSLSGKEQRGGAVGEQQKLQARGPRTVREKVLKFTRRAWPNGVGGV